MLADVVGCLTNALLISGVLHFYQRVPFAVAVRGLLASSGVAYIGYGIIGFLFVILWFPAHLEPSAPCSSSAPSSPPGGPSSSTARSCALTSAPSTRSSPRSGRRSRRPSSGAGGRHPCRVGRGGARPAAAPDRGVRHAATLHEIGHLGVPTRILRRVARRTRSARPVPLRPSCRPRLADDRGYRLPRGRPARASATRTSTSTVVARPVSPARRSRSRHASSPSWRVSRS